MSQANTGGAANRSVGGHIKEGFKNIPKVYNAMYNQRTAAGAKLGSATTTRNNVKTILTGRASPTAPMKSPKLRAQMAGVGLSTVTPAGPVVGFAMGVKQSIKDKKDARAAAAPRLVAPPRLAAPMAIDLKKGKPAKPAAGGKAPGGLKGTAGSGKKTK